MSVKISKRHFLTPVELTDLGTKNPVNLRKKDVKNPLSYRCRITKKAKDLAGVNG
nr:MAG TPA: hypothetical protein [Bacteriophage sp.]